MDNVTPVTTGTSTPYVVYTEKEGTNTLQYQSITAMPVYRGTSLEACLPLACTSSVSYVYRRNFASKTTSKDGKLLVASASLRPSEQPRSPEESSDRLPNSIPRNRRVRSLALVVLLATPRPLPIPLAQPRGRGLLALSVNLLRPNQRSQQEPYLGMRLASRKRNSHNLRLGLEPLELLNLKLLREVLVGQLLVRNKNQHSG
jgi:hypothetical protein